MKAIPLTIAAVLMPLAATAATVNLNSEIGAGSNAGQLYKEGSTFYLNAEDTKRDDATVKYLSLSKGDYKITPTEDLFDSWSRWRASRGCDDNGENCDKGFQFSLGFFLPGGIMDDGKVAVNRTAPIDDSMVNLVNQSDPGDGNFFETSAGAYADVAGLELARFTLDSDQEVGFFIHDNIITDNQNGVSFEVSPVPLPASLPLLLAGLGGLAYFRRNRKA